MKSYHKLKIVHLSKELILLIYKLTDKFPRSEEFNLKSQLRRAAVSVLLNIVEGHRKRSNKEFYRFLETADCSLTEVEVGLEICVDLELITKNDYQKVELKRSELAGSLVKFMQQVQKGIS